MDPIGVVSSFVAILQIATRVLNKGGLSGWTRREKEDIELEFDIHVRILSDLSKEVLTSKYHDPTLAVACTQLCRKRLLVFEACVQRNGSKKLIKPNEMEIRDALAGFTNAVKIIRDVATDAYTHELLRLQVSQQDAIKEQQHQLLSLMEFIGHDLRPSSQRAETPPLLRDLADELRSSLQPPAGWQPSTNLADPFSFSATILRAHEDDADHIVARGKLDSGCDDNWVAMEVVQRGNLQDQVEQIQDGETYVAFGGDEFAPMGRIDITWYAVNAGKSRRTTFLVHENPPFDLVLGRIFIAKESIFVFDKAALALRHGNFSSEEHRIIEENARKHGATSDQLGQIRRADEAAARERRRLQKASSRMSMTPASQSTVSLLSGIGSHAPLSTTPQRLPSLSQTLSTASAAQTTGAQSPSPPAQQPAATPDPGPSGTSNRTSGTMNTA